MPMPLVRRIELLEGNVNALRQLPEQVSAVAADLAEFRGEVRTEFAAVREEIRAGDEETRRQMRILHEEVISRIGCLVRNANRAAAVSSKHEK
jgi:vacuolar-type H+-ATPase subunit I/STV1